MAEHQDEHATATAEQRRALWDDLPAPVAPEETTPSTDATPTPPDLVPDPEHQFMIRHG